MKEQTLWKILFALHIIQITSVAGMLYIIFTRGLS